MIQVRIEGDSLIVDLGKMATRSLDLQPALEDFHRKMVTRIDQTFEQAGGPGAGVAGGKDLVRGITWRRFTDQYRRFDGTVVPAWGGTPRVDGMGLVKARMRASGKRLKPQSLLAQDTGRLRRQAATGVVRVTPTSLTFGPNIEYAEAQNNLRPFLILTESDQNEAMISIYDHLLGVERNE